MKWTNQAVNRSTSNYLSHIRYSHKSINLNSIQAGISQGIYTLILITLIKRLFTNNLIIRRNYRFESTKLKAKLF